MNLKSRKLWITVITIVLSALGVLPPEGIGASAAYVLGQGYVDGKAAE